MPYAICLMPTTNIHPANACIKSHIFSLLFCLQRNQLVAQNSTFALSFEGGSVAVFLMRNGLKNSLITSLNKD